MLVVSTAIQIPMSEVQLTFVTQKGETDTAKSRSILSWNIKQNTTIPNALRRQLIDVLGRRVSRQGDLVIKSGRSEDRSQNVAECLDKFKDILVKATAQTQRRGVKNKPLKELERIEIKRRRGQKKKMRRKVRELVTC